MRIEEGKFYRTRDGRKVGPAKKQYGGRFEFDGAHSHCHALDGKYLGRDSSLDVVAEWPEGPVVTETVQRIKPGVYGPLRVRYEINVPDCERPDDPSEKRIEVSLVHTDLNAPELREMARVALEIAEYLDAQ